MGRHPTKISVGVNPKRNLWRKLKARWKKSKQKGSMTIDVKHKRIKYFVLQPEVKSVLYL